MLMKRLMYESTLLVSSEGSCGLGALRTLGFPYFRSYSNFHFSFLHGSDPLTPLLLPPYHWVSDLSKIPPPPVLKLSHDIP